MLTSNRPVTIAIALVSLLALLQAPSAEALTLSPSSSTTLGEGHHYFGAFHSSKEGSFADTYRFTISGDTGTYRAKYGVIEFDPLPHIPILDLSNLRINGQSHGQWHQRVLEAGTEYTLTVTGHVTGLLGGKYLGKLKLSAVNQAAVPLPAAAWLFLSALGSLLIIGRTRRQFSTAAAV